MIRRSERAQNEGLGVQKGLKMKDGGGDHSGEADSLDGRALEPARGLRI